MNKHYDTEDPTEVARSRLVQAPNGEGEKEGLKHEPQHLRYSNRSVAGTTGITGYSNGSPEHCCYRRNAKHQEKRRMPSLCFPPEVRRSQCR